MPSHLATHDRLRRWCRERRGFVAARTEGKCETTKAFFQFRKDRALFLTYPASWQSALAWYRNAAARQQDEGKPVTGARGTVGTSEYVTALNMWLQFISLTAEKPGDAIEAVDQFLEVLRRDVGDACLSRIFKVEEVEDFAVSGGGREHGTTARLDRRRGSI